MAELPLDGSLQAERRSHIGASLVLPIGATVAVAIICVVVAAFTSAHRAAEVAAEQERQLLIAGIRSYAARMAREVESVATSKVAINQIAGK